MQLIMLKLVVYACIWFVMMASTGGMLGIVIISALKRGTYNSKLILNSVFAVFWCVVVAIYYAVLLYMSRITSPYDSLSIFSVILVASLPFLVACILAYWLLRNLRIGW
jgi:hypothetical protein